MMKDYSAYLFDADGTLIDTTELIYQCFLNTFRVYAKRDVAREEIFPYIGLPLLKQFELYFGALDSARAAEMTQTHMDFQLKIADQYLRAFPDVSRGLSMLKKKGKSLAVVTSRRMNTLQLYLDKTGLLGFFDALVTPESTALHKPDAEPALKAAQLLGFRVGESLMIGDSVFDIECGKNAGMDTAFVSWSQCKVSGLSTPPTYIIDDILNLVV